MKYFIKNDKDQSLCIQVFESTADEKKLAFICHGLTGYKEQDVIMQTKDSLYKQGYTVVCFDCRNSRGESFNDGKCATLTDFINDLSLVIEWAKKQSFFVSPFLLAGHSLGGACVTDYAQKHPNFINRLVLISSIFSGEEFFNNTQINSPAFLEDLRTKGIIRSRNGVDCFLDFSYLQDALQYNFYKNIQVLTMPVLLITGDKDTASLPENNRCFYKQLQSVKFLYILDNCSHIYDLPENQNDLNNILTQFLVD